MFIAGPYHSCEPILFWRWDGYGWTIGRMGRDGSTEINVSLYLIMDKFRLWTWDLSSSRKTKRCISISVKVSMWQQVPIATNWSDNKDWDHLWSQRGVLGVENIMGRLSSIHKRSWCKREDSYCWQMHKNRDSSALPTLELCHNSPIFNECQTQSALPCCRDT